MRVVEGILQGAEAEQRLTLMEHEVYQILEAAGMPTPPWRFWPGEPGAAVPAEIVSFLEGLASPEVVLKIASPGILHKSDVGGLTFSGRSSKDVLAAAQKIWKDTGRNAPHESLRGILVTERVSGIRNTLAAELLISIKQDPAFGPAIVFGLGGLLTEWYGGFSGGLSTIVLQPGRVGAALERLVPLLPFLQYLFRPSRSHPQPPLNLAAAVDLLEGLGRLAREFSGDSSDTPFTLEELEVNPVLVTSDGRWVAVDGVARFSRSKIDTPTRPLSKIANLLSPKSAVVIGASAKGMNPGRIILRNLKIAGGITYGHLYVVHPKESEIDGIPCVSSLEALPEKCDLAVVSIPAEGARDAIRTLCERDLAASIILIPGGFAETGKKDLEEEIISTLRASRSKPGGGPVLVGGNCLGIVSKHQYNTFFLPQYKLPFHEAPGDHLVAVSQSGAYLVTLTSNLDGIIFPRASISYGNQMDLTVSDFLEYFLEDETVKVLACYIEGFKPRDGERFARLARVLKERGKRVIAFKAGKTALGAKAAQSHTASLAGDYAVTRFLLYDAGVIVAETLNMFEDYAKVYTMLWDRIPPKHEEKGRRVAVISNAGFECSAVLDKLYNLRLAQLSTGTRGLLKEYLPSIAHADNPIDATPMADTPQFIDAARAMLDDPAVDALLVSPIPVTPALDNLAPDIVGTHSENIYSPRSLPQELLRLFHETSKPIVVSVDSGRLYDDFAILLQRGGLPVYRKIDRASRALSALCTL